MVTTPGYATENARERRDARDTKQDSRQEAREQKLDCRAANQRTMPNAVRRSATPSRVAVKSHVTSDGEQRQGEQRQREQRHRTKSRKRGFQLEWGFVAVECATGAMPEPAATGKRGTRCAYAPSHVRHA